MTLYTVGHGLTPIARFIEVIDEHGIDVVLDVRYRPHSWRNPAFDYAALKISLGKRYVFDGDRLGNAVHFGGEPIEDDARAAAIDDLEQRLRIGERVAIMCSESRPDDCHRVTIADDLALRGFAIVHFQINHAAKKRQALAPLPLFSDQPLP